MNNILYLFTETADNLCYVSFEGVEETPGTNLIFNTIIITDPITNSHVNIMADPVPRTLIEAKSDEECAAINLSTSDIVEIALWTKRTHSDGCNLDVDFSFGSNNDTHLQIIFPEPAEDVIDTHVVMPINDPKVTLLAQHVLNTQKHVLASFLAQKDFLDTHPDVVTKDEPIKPYMYTLAKLGLDFLEKVQTQFIPGATPAPTQ